MMNNYEYFQYSTSKKYMVKHWFQAYTIRIFRINATPTSTPPPLPDPIYDNHAEMNDE